MASLIATGAAALAAGLIFAGPSATLTPIGTLAGVLALLGLIASLALFASASNYAKEGGPGESDTEAASRLTTAVRSRSNKGSWIGFVSLLLVAAMVGSQFIPFLSETEVHVTSVEVSPPWQDLCPTLGRAFDGTVSQADMQTESTFIRIDIAAAECDSAANPRLASVWLMLERSRIHLSSPGLG